MSVNELEFKNKVVLITGGNDGGIGGQIAVDFAENGASVALVSRSLAKLKLTENKCKQKRKECEVLLIESDLSKFENLEGLITKVMDKFERLDILVNNAAITYSTQFSDEKFDAIMKINVKAPMFLSHYATPHLEKTKGSIINISSIATMLNPESHLEYSMSKAALNKMADILAKLLAPKGIRVNTVSPGSTNTPMLNKEFTEEIKIAMAPLQPLGGILEPKAISNMVIFLASDGAKNTTGTDLAVDGGCLAAR